MSKLSSQLKASERLAAPGAPSHASSGLGARVAFRLSFGLVLIAAILFLTAGTWRYWQGWAFLAIVFPSMSFIFLYFLRRDPQLLERRLQGKEEVPTQRILIRAIGVFFFAAFLLPGLDHRFGWSRTLLGDVPLWLTIVADIAVLGGVAGAGWVVDINRFAARTIRVEPDQPVICRGPYSLVRHPMYSASILLWLAIPLALDSYVASPVFALLILFYVFRLLNEENVLRRDLKGYSAYCKRTPFRLVPFVW